MLSLNLKKSRVTSHQTSRRATVRAIRRILSLERLECRALLTCVDPTVAIQFIHPDALEGEEFELFVSATEDEDCILTGFDVDWGDGESDSFEAEEDLIHIYADDDPTNTEYDEHLVEVTAHWQGSLSDSDSKDIAVYNVVPAGIEDYFIPVAADDVITTGNVLVNDIDVPGDTLSVRGIDTSMTHGLVTNHGNETFTYDPNGYFDYLTGDQTAEDSFLYHLADDDQPNFYVDTYVIFLVHAATWEPPVAVPPSACEDCNSQVAASEPLSRPQGGVAGTIAPAAVTKAPIRYHDGAVLLGWNDLQSDGYGMPWGVTRSWTNRSGYVAQNTVGHGMVISQQPHLMSFGTGGAIAVITNGTTARYFDYDNGDYVPRYFLQEKLEYDAQNDQYVLTDTTGALLRFEGFDHALPVAQQGSFVSYTDPSGNETLVTSRTGDGQIEDVQRSVTVGGDTLTESFFYTFLDTGDNAGLLGSVEQRKKVNSGSWTTVREVNYAYYGSSEDFGNLGDLKSVEITDGTNLIDRLYYRYYQPSEAGGYTHGLKMVFGAASVARLLAGEATTFANVGTIADEDAKIYADNYFEYDAQRRAVVEVAQGDGCSACSAGLGEYNLAYTASNNSPGHNSWAVKTVETLPDGNEHIVYTNAYGQMMLKVFHRAIAS